MIGGKDFLSMTFSVMDYTISRDVAKNYTFHGNPEKGMSAFKDKFLAKMIKCNYSLPMLVFLV